MESMRKRRWNLASIILVVAAIASHIPRWHHAALGMTTAARSGPPGSVGDLWPSASWHAKRSGLWSGVSLGVAILAVACWGVAHFAGERAAPTTLIVLLIIYALLSLMIV